MSVAQIAVRNIVTIKKDSQTWLLASNPNAIVFPESLANTEYARMAIAPGKVVTYSGSKLQTGFAINIDADTAEGYYEVTGESLIYRDTAVVGASLIQTIYMPLVEGDNVITFASPYADDMWVCAWPGFDANIVIGAKTATGVTLNSPIAIPGFSMIVSGTAA